jgi:NAD(P)-dependent dehydrogenase (short-subunit alcohol dehydrogenase family)
MMTESTASLNALIIGTGGIGQALAARLRQDSRYASVNAAGRSNGVDPLDEPSLAALSATLSVPLDLVVVTTGMLHDDQQGPEKSLRDLDAARLARSFAINTIAPALVAKHVVPLLRRDARTVFAALGARVGSIGDNRTGGWHGYRASKAALVMMMKTLSIEVARSRPQAIVATLHPGTVDTAMSKPFQRGVAPEKLFTPAVAAGHLIDVMAVLTTADSGGHFAWDGARIAD